MAENAIFGGEGMEDMIGEGVEYALGGGEDPANALIGEGPEPV
jgi:hypothetical protein